MAPRIHTLYESQNNKPNLLLIMGMWGCSFVCWILFESSRIGIQLQCFIVACLRYFIATIRQQEMDLQPLLV
jgi:hypothetical protein